MNLFLSALGLVFVIEGLMPFLAPNLWRKAMQQMTLQNNSSLRIFGLINMLIGLLLLYVLRHN